MISHEKPSRPWEAISIDLIGPLTRSTKGNTSLLVVMDYHTKFTLVFALKNAIGGAVVRKWEENVFLLFGVPRTNICDTGPQFRNSECQKLDERYQCKLRYNAYYHKRANPTERQNRTLKTMLSMYVHKNHRTWDSELAKVACALRTAKHKTTGITPYFANFGTIMTLSGDDYDKLILNKEDGIQTAEISRNALFIEMFLSIKSRLKKVAKKTVERYNLRRRWETLEPNQLVWRRNFVLSGDARYFAKKLAPRYLGPLYVHKRVSPRTYVLRYDNGSILPENWHT